MRKKDLELFKQAIAIASSGRCRNWREVQDRLVKEGHKRAPDLLDGDKIRAIINVVCERALAA